MNRELLPGDLVLAHSKGAFAVLIRFGQWLRPSWRPYKKWNHAAVVVDVGGVGEPLCVQMGRRGQLSPLSDVAPGGYVEIRPMPAGVDRTKAVHYAKEQIGVKYSVAAIFSIALTLLTPKMFHFDFRRKGNSLICSALVARCWEHGGWSCPTDPFQITPAELAKATEGD